MKSVVTLITILLLISCSKNSNSSDPSDSDSLTFQQIPLTFNTLSDIARDNDSNYYFLESENCRILKYDSKFRILDTLFRKGMGPGDLSDCYLFETTSDKNLITGNWGKGKVEVFDKCGKSIRAFGFEQTKNMGAIKVLDNDSFILGTVDHQFEKYNISKMYISTGSVVNYKDLDFKASYMLPENNARESFTLAVNKEYLCYRKTNENLIHFIHLDTKKKYQLITKYPKIKYNQTERELLIEEQIQGYTKAFNEGWYSVAKSYPKTPPDLPDYVKKTYTYKSFSIGLLSYKNYFVDIVPQKGINRYKLVFFNKDGITAEKNIYVPHDPWFHNLGLERFVIIGDFLYCIYYNEEGYKVKMAKIVI